MSSRFRCRSLKPRSSTSTMSAPHTILPGSRKKGTSRCQVACASARRGAEPFTRRRAPSAGSVSALARAAPACHRVSGSTAGVGSGGPTRHLASGGRRQHQASSPTTRRIHHRSGPMGDPPGGPDGWPGNGHSLLPGPACQSAIHRQAALGTPGEAGVQTQRLTDLPSLATPQEAFPRHTPPPCPR
jgi:hypothetical protein